MKRLPLLISLICVSVISFAQVSPQSDLYKQIMVRDSLLFNVGFNTCDISQFEKLLSDDLEFFHDKDSISNKATFLYNLRNGLCGSPSDVYQSRRELLKGTTVIYPLYKGTILYGAIQLGTHSFYEKLAGKKERFASTAKFTHVWILEKGDWRLKTSLSYDHQTKPRTKTIR